MAANFINSSACLRRYSQVSKLISNGRRFTQASSSLQTFKQNVSSNAAAADSRATTDINLRTSSSSSLTTEEEKKQIEAKIQRNVKTQLKYMNDPWKIGKHVENILRQDKFEEAFLLTKEVSTNGDYAVSWNHLIEYKFKNKQFKDALKLFNDMKRRGQFANVQTYTIIFNGCAQYDHPKVAVAEAFKHYNLLLNDRRLQPNSTHMNALLYVCSQAGDLDSMFHIVNTINESTRTPTAFTYTIIINALRYHASKDLASLSKAQQEKNILVAVDRAKSIWSEVLDKWTKGKFPMDEALVCAMGRLLLMSPKSADKLQVLDLLQQTMDIPNFTSKQRKREAKRRFERENREPTKDDSAADSSPRDISARRRQDHLGRYVTPGCNTLGLVLKTVGVCKLTNVGLDYWQHLVNRTGIVPDQDCWLRLFGMLKVAKSSAHAASFLPLVPDADINPRMYRIAMETCVRDNINPNVTSNAKLILDSMLTRCKAADLHTLRLYLHTSLVSHSRFRIQAEKDDSAKAKRNYALQITKAIDDLWEPYKAAHFRYFKSKQATVDTGSTDSIYNGQREVISLARALFSAFNKVLNEEMLPKEERDSLRPIGAKINREIQAFYSNRPGMEPKLNSSRAANDALKEPDQGDALLNQGSDFIWNTRQAQARKVIERSRRSGVDKRSHNH